MTRGRHSIPLASGVILGGKYRLERLLGAGGMGSVYRALHVDIDRQVAIKILEPHLAEDAANLTRFQREARAAARIGHPNIIDVTDFGKTSEGAPFIVMELLEGETLGARIKRAGVLSPREAVAIGREVLDALAAVHAAEVVHRDLKPENIFLVERPAKKTKILDFGISKFQSEGDLSVTQTGAMMGTPMFMAPEQIRGAKDVGPAADLYSVGVILYAALSGHAPFMATSYTALIAKVLTERHEPLIKARPDVPAALSNLVDRLLAKDPADRPKSALEVTQALEASISRPASNERAADITSPPRLPETDTGAGASASRSERPLAGGSSVLRSRRVWPLLAASGVLSVTLAVVVFGGGGAGEEPPKEPAPRPRDQRRVEPEEPPLPVPGTTKAAVTGVSAEDRAASSTTSPAPTRGPEPRLSSQIAPPRPRAVAASRDARRDAGAAPSTAADAGGAQQNRLTIERQNPYR